MEGQCKGRMGRRCSEEVVSKVVSDAAALLVRREGGSWLVENDEWYVQIGWERRQVGSDERYARISWGCQ